MDLHHLRYFVSVVQAGSFARAAERLAMAASPLSRRVKDLERYMGQPLLRREGQRLLPTTAGARLLAIAEPMLAMADEVESLRLRDAYGGPLRIGIMPGMPPRVSVALGAMLGAEESGRELLLDPRPSREQGMRLLAGQLDLGIIRVPLADPSLEALPLLDEEVVIVLPRAHGDALPDPLPPRALAGWEHVTSYSTHVAESIDRFVAEQDLGNQRFLPGADLRTILAVVEHSHGFTFAMAGDEDIDPERFTVRRARWPLAATTYLARRKDRRDLDDYVESMLAHMHA